MSTEKGVTGGAGASTPLGAALGSKWANPSYLRDVQYATPANLAARQAIYRYQRPQLGLYDWAIDLADLSGGETILDIGCGNGAYLATLHRRGHVGLTVGTDFSSGMLSSARQARGAHHARPVVQGDATALPFSASAADVVLSMHMLYHVPQPLRAVVELRRVVRAGGRVLIVLNEAAHQGQLRALLRDTRLEFGESGAGGASELFDLDAGEEMASRFFDVQRHEVHGELVIPEPAPVLDYVKSMGIVQSGHAREAEMLRSVEAKIAETINAEGAFRITTSCGCLVCR